jgi:hypothetical protein
VIGGLLCATFATLLFVPTVFSLLHRKTAAAANLSDGDSETHRHSTEHSITT